MSPERNLHKQAGIGLPIAIFIITVLALLVAGMAQLQESTGKSVSLQIQSQRAFFAAESGAQVAVISLLEGGSCPARIDFPGQGLSGCAAILGGCSAGDLVHSGAGRFFRIKSLGVCGEGSSDKASRTVEVMIRED